VKEFILLNHRFEINSVNEHQMAELAVLIGQILNGNDTLLLKGEIGAGKSYFSRKLIQSQQIFPEEVPSPTFTLVQTYETKVGEIWHVDLYRLTHADGLIELGLSEAFEDKICLLEWPDLALDIVPENALSVEILITGELERQIKFSWSCSDYWSDRIGNISENYIAN
jgi:tRNA threonylcarbamoyladenosine biosynthesis protein TsaE